MSISEGEYESAKNFLRWWEEGNYAISKNNLEEYRKTVEKYEKNKNCLHNYVVVGKYKWTDNEGYGMPQTYEEWSVGCPNCKIVLYGEEYPTELYMDGPDWQVCQELEDMGHKQLAINIAKKLGLSRFETVEVEYR